MTDDLWRRYLRHLPLVEPGQPFEAGRVYHTVIVHQSDCPIFSGGGCTCVRPLIATYVEPVRS